MDVFMSACCLLDNPALYSSLSVFDRCWTSGATLRIVAAPATTATTTTAVLASSTAHVRRRTTTSAGNALSARPAHAGAIFFRRHVGDVIFSVAVALYPSKRPDRK